MKTRHWIVAASITDLLFLYLPIAILIVFSFNASKFSARWQGFSLQWWRGAPFGDAQGSLFTDPELHSAILQTLRLSVVAMAVGGSKPGRFGSSTQQ